MLEDAIPLEVLAASALLVVLVAGLGWGLTDAFTTTLKGLTSYGDSNTSATVFSFKEKEAYPPRKWYTSWDTKWYLAPIPAVEINKNYGMTQNPGW